MPTPTRPPTDTEAFLVFLADEVKNGGASKSPKELLQTWRAEHAGAIDDIRQGIADLEAGRFRPFAEVDAQFRQKFDLSSEK